MSRRRGRTGLAALVWPSSVWTAASEAEDSPPGTVLVLGAAEEAPGELGGERWKKGDN